MSSSAPRIALARVNADTGLYKKMLISFQETFSNADQLMGQYLRKGQWEAAYRLSHAIAGVAGNIGADGIFQSARKLCDVLETDKKEQWRPALDAFLREFSMLSSALNELRLEEPPPVLPANQMEAVDPAAAVAMLRNLIALLEKRNSRAMNALQALKHTLPDPCFHDRLERLDRAIYNLDYKKSISIVAQLIREVDTFLKKE
jgi:HPt (histidine-containing phosphotransfer) domain-containing protein